MSLRWRIVASLVALYAALAALGLLGLAAWQSARAARSQSAHLSATAADFVAHAQIAGLPGSDAELAAWCARQGQATVACLRDASGRIQATTQAAALGSWPWSAEGEPAEAGLLGSGVAAPALVDLEPGAARRLFPGERRARVATLAFELRAAPGRAAASGFVQIARPVGARAELGRALARLWFPALPLGLLAAGLAAWIIAGRVTAPMQRLALAARGVRPEAFDERLALDFEAVEFRRLQDELNAALERIERGQRAQERFLGNVAHELKTPIATILAELQVHDATCSDPDVRQLHASLTEELRRLAALAESFLTLARAELGQAAAQWTALALNDLTLDALARNGSTARRRGIRLQPRFAPPSDAQGEVLVRGDEKLLGSLLDNLLQNAIRFSPEGGTLDVGVFAEANEALLRVRDRGPGIPASELHRLFERFVQGGVELGRARGFGLGLAIARSIVELHSGSISVEAPERGGSEFVVRLPLARA